MKMNDTKLDKLLHKFPTLITELKHMEQELMELRQGFIKAIEDEGGDDK